MSSPWFEPGSFLYALFLGSMSNSFVFELGQATTLCINIAYKLYSLTTETVVLYRFFFSMALPAHSGPWPLIQFCNHFSQTVELLGRVISQLQGRYLNTGQHKHRINTPTDIKHLCLEWDWNPRSNIERAKTVHASDRGATVTGSVTHTTD
jgi:hypothetical protein